MVLCLPVPYWKVRKTVHYGMQRSLDSKSFALGGLFVVPHFPHRREREHTFVLDIYLHVG